MESSSIPYPRRLRVESRREVQPRCKKRYTTREKIKNVFAKRFHLPTKSVGFQLQFAARPVKGGFVMLMPRTRSGTAAHHCLVSIERNMIGTEPSSPRLLVKNHTEERATYPQSAIVVNETELPEFVHEEIYA